MGIGREKSRTQQSHEKGGPPELEEGVNVKTLEIV